MEPTIRSHPIEGWALSMPCILTPFVFHPQHLFSHPIFEYSSSRTFIVTLYMNMHEQQCWYSYTSIFICIYIHMHEQLYIHMHEQQCWGLSPFRGTCFHTHYSSIIHILRHYAHHQGRVCPSIEFEFMSTKMGQDFSVPIKSTTRLVLKEFQNRKFELWVCGLTREKLNEFPTLSLSGSSKLWVSSQTFLQQTKSIDGQTRPSIYVFFVLAWRKPNLITRLSRWHTPD